MIRKINISIPEPCHENWNEMIPLEKGRFCNVCKKNVFDFTFATDREIVQAYYKNNNLCGRFDVSQLNRDLIIPKEKKSIWLAMASAIISFLGIGTHETLAQEKVKVEETENKINTNKNIYLDETVEISGFVIDQDSNPISNIIIKINGSEISKSDANGEFSIFVENCKNIHFFDLNNEYEEGFYRVDGPKNNVKIVCEKYLIKTKASCSTTGVVRIITTETISRKKRPFFGRIFYSIGNWFR